MVKLGRIGDFGVHTYNEPLKTDKVESLSYKKLWRRFIESQRCYRNYRNVIKDFKNAYCDLDNI